MGQREKGTEKRKKQKRGREWNRKNEKERGREQVKNERQ